MRTSRKERGAPGPSDPWNEIVPGLWMGGHHYTPPGGEPELAVVRNEFDLDVAILLTGLNG